MEAKAWPGWLVLREGQEQLGKLQEQGQRD